jgi:hypothetical protein
MEETERREVKLRFRKNQKEEKLWQMVKPHTDKASFVKECIEYYYNNAYIRVSHPAPIDVSGIL